MRFLVQLGVGLVGVAALASCAGLLEIDGIAFGDSDEGGAGAGAASSGGSTTTQGGGSNSGGSGGEPTSSGGSPPDTCGDDAVCTPPIPAGWDGPVVVTKVGIDDPLSECPQAWAEGVVQLKTDITTQLHACGGCTCNPPEGGTCVDGVDLAMTSDGQCFGPQIGGTSSPTCDSQGMAGLFGIIGSVPTVASPGSCTAASTGEPNIPDPFASAIRVCGGAMPQDGDCPGADQSCYPAGGDAYQNGICIYSTMDQTCPTDFPVGHQSFGGFNDSRDCSACSCNPPTNRACHAATTVYDGSNCMGLSETIVHNGQCHDTAFAFASYKLTTYTTEPVEGSCTSDGGAPTGELDGTGEVLICCTN